MNHFEKFSSLSLALMFFLGLSASSSGRDWEDQEGVMKQTSKEALKRLEIAFEREILDDFLDGVSPQYLPELLPELKTNLIRRFDTSDQIRVRIVVDEAVIHQEQERVALETRWRRRWLATGASGLTRSEGRTTFFFELKNDEAKLVDIKGDVLFG